MAQHKGLLVGVLAVAAAALLSVSGHSAQAADDPKNEGEEPIKELQTPNGWAWKLFSDGELRANGERISNDAADFAFDKDQRLIVLNKDRLLARSLRAYGGGGWNYDFGDNRKVVKFAVLGNDVFSLSTDNWLFVNDRGTWARTDDFAVAADGALYWLGNDATAGASDSRLQVSTLPGGTGGFKTFRVNVAKFQIAPTGDVFVLQRDGWLSMNGRRSQARTIDFKIGKDGRVYWLGNDASAGAGDRRLQVSRKPLMEGGWVTLHTGVSYFWLSGLNDKLGVAFVKDQNTQPDKTTAEGNRVGATAKDDCQIVREQDKDIFLVYVKNMNAGRKIRVTVSVTENSAKGGTGKLPDKVMVLAAGERGFCGSDRSGDATYTYSVSGATYE